MFKILIVLLCVIYNFNLWAKDPAYNIKTLFETQGVIWGFEILDDQSILYTLKDGTMHLYDVVKKKNTRIQNTPQVYSKGQGGLLDVKLAPDFSQSARIYLTYSVDLKASKETRLSTAIVKDHQLTNFKPLFTSQTGSNKNVHFGSRIAFDHKGHLFFTVGDRGQRDHAQSLDKDHGKIFRLTLDGAVPKDNPFKGKKNRSAIWSYGHRNPQGIYFDSKEQILFANEHGPRGGDEINEIQKGKNYGWPVITYGREYYGPKIGDGKTHHPDMEQPLYHFTPSIAPSSLIRYQGEMFPALEDAFVSGALALQHLNIVKISKRNTEEIRWLEELKERIRNVVISQNGAIIVSTDSGKILEITNSTD